MSFRSLSNSALDACSPAGRSPAGASSVDCSPASAFPASCSPAGFPLTDAHAHCHDDGELSLRQESGITSLICAATPPEARALLSREPSSFLIPTAGLHPWHADQYPLSEMIPFLADCPVVGEIGMDSVWCDTPLDVQEEVFRRQLALAAQWKKPVILHTKGQEKEIAAILREYPNTYLVHWYSCARYLEEYLALDCYFSIGPDVWWNPTVQETARRVPLNRLLMETDGMGAVRWAWEEAPARGDDSLWEYEPARENTPVRKGVSVPAKSAGKRPPLPATPAEALTATLLTISRIRHLAPGETGALLEWNLREGFLKDISQRGTSEGHLSLKQLRQSFRKY